MSLGQGAVDCLMLHRAPEKNLEQFWAVLEEEAFRGVWSHGPRWLAKLLSAISLYGFW